MTERVVQYIDRAMIGRRITVGVYTADKPVYEVAGRLSRYSYDMTTMHVYFEGSGNTPSVWFKTADNDFVVTWDPEERD